MTQQDASQSCGDSTCGKFLKSFNAVSKAAINRSIMKFHNRAISSCRRYSEDKVRTEFALRSDEIVARNGEETLI